VDTYLYDYLLGEHTGLTTVISNSRIVMLEVSLKYPIIVYHPSRITARADGAVAQPTNNEPNNILTCFHKIYEISRFVFKWGTLFTRMMVTTLNAYKFFVIIYFL
jgi:hypothetical protein